MIEAESIGGYFELELQNRHHYHNDALQFNTARNCLKYVLLTRKYEKVFIPFYTCKVILQSIQELGIGYEFYQINESLEPLFLPSLNPGEAFLYTNYFGLKQNCVTYLAALYGNRLIVDNAQAFFADPVSGIDSFYSARKFFGVPDGAYLYTDSRVSEGFETDSSFSRCAHLLKRLDLCAEIGYMDFCANESSLDGQPIKLMSKLTQRLLQSIDYEYTKEQRLANFRFLKTALQNNNLLQFSTDDNTIPMVYPYLSMNENLRDVLIANKIYVACYWPEVLRCCKETSWEYTLAHNLCCLPIDQRYGQREMERIVSILYN